MKMNFENVSLSKLNSNLNKIIGLIVAGSTIYSISKHLLSSEEPFWLDLPYLYSKLEILTEMNNKTVYSIKCELESLLDHNLLIQMEDGSINPSFTIPYGVYYLSESNVTISYRKDKITIYSSSLSIKELKSYMESIYLKHCSPERIIISYTSFEDKWSHPIIRRPTNFLVGNLTNKMKETLDDINYFLNASKVYEANGVPYRRGYLLYGVPGSGKTSIIEIVAKTYNMQIYTLFLNANGMTDTSLVNLISSIPPRSIIVLDEIDRQLDALKANKNIHISIAGLLSAIDGPQRLSYSTIIIMTANIEDFLDEKNGASLFRKGRIDRLIEFNEVVNISL